MTKEQTPGALVREIRQYLSANAHLCGVEDSMLDDAALDLARLVLGAGRQPAKREACQDSGIVGHSDICPCCRGTWKPADPVLESPAKVGAARFGKGIKWSTVIGAAQRLYQHEVTPEKEAERIARSRESIAKIQQELAQAPDALRWQALRRAAATNDEDFLRRVTEALADDCTPTEDEIDAAVDAAMEVSHA